MIDTDRSGHLSPAPNRWLPYIDDSDLEAVVSSVLAADNKGSDYVPDPFSAVFDATIQGISLDLWLEQESRRKAQKTLQNKIGYFHQRVLGRAYGCEDLGVGHGIDFRCKEKRIVAEIKNKYNTTKGSDRAKIYDILDDALSNGVHAGYTGYYVEVVPSVPGGYNKPFAPPDSINHSKKTASKNIRMIDGRSFYALVTGIDDALDQLYSVLPGVLEKLGLSNQTHTDTALYEKMYRDAYGVSVDGEARRLWEI